MPIESSNRPCPITSCFVKVYWPMILRDSRVPSAIPKFLNFAFSKPGTFRRKISMAYIAFLRPTISAFVRSAMSVQSQFPTNTTFSCVTSPSSVILLHEPPRQTCSSFGTIPSAIPSTKGFSKYGLNKSSSNPVVSIDQYPPQSR